MSRRQNKNCKSNNPESVAIRDLLMYTHIFFNNDYIHQFLQARGEVKI
jgi:hypothetical protein